MLVEKPLLLANDAHASFSSIIRDLKISGGVMAQSKEIPVVEYPKIVAFYEDRLETMLRGFSIDHAFLETWVPDEDHTHSIYDLFEAANQNSLLGLQVRVAPEIENQLDGERLSALLTKLGSIEVVRTSAGMELKVRFGTRDEKNVQIDAIRGISGLHPVYREKLIQLTRSFKHQAEAFPIGAAFFSDEFGGVKFFVQIDPQSTRVLCMGYESKADDVRVRLLEVLCSICEGFSFQEVAEHGAIRLENTLRDETMPKPVLGIVTPKTAGELFAKISQSLRRVFDQFRKQSQYSLVRNTTEVPFAFDWQNASETLRIQMIQNGITTCRTEGLAIDPSLIAVEALRNDCQLYIDIGGDATENDRRRICKTLEKHLKKSVEPRIEVYLPTAMDKARRDKRKNSLFRGTQVTLKTKASQEAKS